MSGPSSRMLALLSLLQVRRDWPGPTLAGRLGISERTVRRDVDRLRELGYRIRAGRGPDGGYRLDAGSELPPLLFDDEQAIVLAVALQTVVTTDTAFEEPAQRALATVRQVMPSRLRHRIDALQVTAMGSPGAVTADPGVLALLGGAVRGHEIVRFDYGSSGGGALPPRRAEPHHLVARGGRWYLVAWDLDRQAWRTFRVDRMSPRAQTGPGFTPRPLPGGDVRTFVAAHFKGSVGEDAWPCRGEVVLGTSADTVAPYLVDGSVEALGPDRCRVTLGAWSWTALAARIGQLDADVSDVRPPELVAAFAGLAGRFAAAGGSARPDIQ